MHRWSEGKQLQLSIKRAGFEKSNGKTPDVVLIHGTGANADMWQPQVQVLVKHGYRCFLPELRGHGETEEPGEQTDVEVHLQDILETFASLHIAYPAVFIGHSLGAIISLALAERQPELVREILAVAMPGRVLRPISHAFRWFLNGPYNKVKGTKLHRYLPWRERTLISTHHHTLEQILVNFDRLNYVEQPLRITCPVHFAVGRLDPVALFLFVERMHKALPGSTLKIFEWAGHNCMDEQPEKFNAWLLEKLRNAC